MAATSATSVAEIRQAPAGLAANVLPLFGGLALLGVAYALGRTEAVGASRFWHAYLLGVMFVTTLGLGGLFFVIAHHLTGGRWGTPVRRLAELTASTLSTSAILWLPILGLIFSGSAALYPWVDRDLVMSDAILVKKADYLSPVWFTVRWGVCFALWIGMARLFLGLSLSQDSSQPLARAKRMQYWSGPAAVVFALTLNFAAFDWMMSLEPHWFSTMFGVYVFAGAFGAFMALLILMCNLLQDRGVLTSSIGTEQYHDMSKLMFAFIVFWAYVTFSQYMLIWYAAIPEETMWFDIRQGGHWPFVGFLLITGHWLIPFLGFMSKRIRRNRKLMAFWAVWMLCMHWTDLFWIVMPQSRSGSPLPLPWVELMATAGTIGVFVWSLLRAASGKWLMPIQDPRLPIALSYHNH
jgi:hypothetical protein